MSAAERWTDQLAAWAIPQAILEQAPESPWGFPPKMFAPHQPRDRGDSASIKRALEALGGGGTVLDVGVGAGAGSLPLAGAATHLTGVDESTSMLDAFDRAAAAAGIDHDTIAGRWPDVAGSAPRADVVTCFHVLYNAPDLPSFARALAHHAGRRVVTELTAVHPQTTLGPLWKHFWNLERPTGPRAEDALEVLREASMDAHLERFERARHHGHGRSDLVAFVRRRLCLTPDRDPEIEDLLGEEPVFSPPEVATLWWDV
jgi:hypothetical protein